MRPVDRGTSPISSDYNNHRDAFGALTNRIGFYCSYCERRIPTFLHVEHIQPKDNYPHLRGRWDNFLLGCVNCNSTKSTKDVTLRDELLPDRDNTFHAYVYHADGRIEPSPALDPTQKAAAQRTLELVGLDKPISAVRDENGQLVIADRQSQRKEARLIARRALNRLGHRRTPEMEEQIVDAAVGHGHFSTWMDVFKDEIGVRQRLIEAFDAAPDCFDPSTAPVSPRPANGLPFGSKV